MARAGEEDRRGRVVLREVEDLLQLLVETVADGVEGVRSVQRDREELVVAVHVDLGAVGVAGVDRGERRHGCNVYSI